VTRAAAFVLALSLFGCTVGEGEGWVKSDRLYIDDCWNGTFNLEPDFFAGNSFRAQSLMFRIQRGDNIEELSDGLVIVVNNLDEQRGLLGVPVEVGLPLEFRGTGQKPPDVSLGLYLHDSCHAQNGTVYSVGGSITFTSLWSGDLNEDKADERLTEARFDAVFADPRLLDAEGADDPNLSSRVTGYFRFFFQRGQPAQPFQ
jgi:hypothetical protein